MTVPESLKVVFTWDGKQYTFDAQEIDVQQAMVIKLHTGYDMVPFFDAIGQMDPKAIQGVMWLMKVQNGEPCEIKTLNFPLMKFALEFGKAMQAEEQRRESERGQGNAEAPDNGASSTSDWDAIFESSGVSTSSDSPTSVTSPHGTLTTSD